jgi:hypothetical protein
VAARRRNRPARRLSRRALQTPRAVEHYLTAGGPPRWMERLAQIDRGIAREKGRLAEEYAALRHELPSRREFARRWREIAGRQRFDDLNELIEQHNEWYPVERNLPMDIRTRDYVLIHGRSYRRPRLDAGWVLDEFPA